jgi:hypothetical protein
MAAGVPVTYTQTHVYDVAPCGCRLPVPNEAYVRRVRLEKPCEHGRRWSVEVVVATIQGSFGEKASWVEVVE